MSFRIGVDIGGTFTDFTVAREDGSLILWKEDSSPAEPVAAIERGLAAIAEQVGTDVPGMLADTSLFVHGTTIATNMLIQRNGPQIGLLATEGFRDVLYFRDGYKPGRFDVHMPHPEPLVERWLRIGIPERTDASGREVAALDEDAVRRAAAEFRRAEVKAVAVAFMWSMLSPQHELRAEEILREELPHAFVVCSHDVLPEIREWQRTSATVLSAYFMPLVVDYLSRLEVSLQESQLKRPLQIMQINGGCARVEDVCRRPVNLLASGPAAAPAASLHYADVVGQDLITVDMGGTSLDICLIEDGTATMSRDMLVEAQPVGVAAVDVHSIGAGGGSIAGIDIGGALRVGPRSAGSTPGPACYDQGGEEPTVTDANVALGYLDPDRFLGGRRRLRDDLSRRAVDSHVGEPLGLSTVKAAAGIIRVVNTNMVAGVRAVSVERGIDPRRFTLVCGGGAGGLHAVELARGIGIERVFIPLEAGVLCSFGMTITDVRHEHIGAYHCITDSADGDRIGEVLGGLEERARAELLEEGFGEEEISLGRQADARYPGQVHELTVPVPAGVLDGAALRELESRFHERHLAQFAYNREEMPVECLHWRVTAIGRQPVPRPQAQAADSAMPERIGTRQAYVLNRGEMADVDIFAVADIGVGGTVTGPAIITAPTTTIILGEGDNLIKPFPEGFLVDVTKSE
jgi:N-methylhydantoinase A